MKSWHYVLDGTQHGPVEAEEIRAMLTAGMIRRETLVWRDGMAEWQPLGSVPEWTDTLSPSHPAGYPGGAPAAPSSGLAIASLVCGISSLVLLGSCFIGIIAGIPAVICGHMALSQINRAYPAISGRGMAIAGLVTGYLTIALTLTAAVLFAIFGFSVLQASHHLP